MEIPLNSIKKFGFRLLSNNDNHVIRNSNAKKRNNFPIKRNEMILFSHLFQKKYK